MPGQPRRAGRRARRGRRSATQVSPDRRAVAQQPRQHRRPAARVRPPRARCRRLSTPSTSSRTDGGPGRRGGPARRRDLLASRSTSRTVRSGSSPPIAVPVCGSAAASAASAPPPDSITWTCSSSGPEPATRPRGARCGAAWCARCVGRRRPASVPPVGEVELERLAAPGGRAGRAGRCAAGCRWSRRPARSSVRGREPVGQRGQPGSVRRPRARSARRARVDRPGRGAQVAVARRGSRRPGVPPGGQHPPRTPGPSAARGAPRRRRAPPATAAERALPVRRYARPGQVDREVRGRRACPGRRGSRASSVVRRQMPQRCSWPGSRATRRRRAAGWPARGARRATGPAERSTTRPRTNAGQFLGERRELVDDDDQPRQVDVLGQIRDVGDPVRGEDRLAPGQLGGQRPQGPGGRLAVQVGDHADRVRQRGRLGEGGAALVVDQQERAAVRADGSGPGWRSRVCSSSDLPEPGRAGDQRVRARRGTGRPPPARRPSGPASARSRRRAGDHSPVTRSASSTRRPALGQVQQAHRAGQRASRRRPGRARPGRGRSGAADAGQPVDRGRRARSAAPRHRRTRRRPSPRRAGTTRRAATGSSASEVAAVRIEHPDVASRSRRTRGQAAVQWPVDDHDRPALRHRRPTRSAATPAAARGGRPGPSSADEQPGVGLGARGTGRADVHAGRAQVRQPAGPLPGRQYAAHRRAGADRGHPAGAARSAGRSPRRGRHRVYSRGPTTARPPSRRRSTTAGQVLGRVRLSGPVAVDADDAGPARARRPSRTVSCIGVAGRAAPEQVGAPARRGRRASRDRDGRTRRPGLAARTASASRASRLEHSPRVRGRLPAAAASSGPSVGEPGAHGDDRAEQGEEQERRRAEQPGHQHAADRGQGDGDPREPTRRRRRRWTGEGDLDARRPGDRGGAAGGAPDASRPIPGATLAPLCTGAARVSARRAQADDGPDGPGTGLRAQFRRRRGGCRWSSRGRRP